MSGPKSGEIRIKFISSRDNPLVKYIKRLAASRRWREREGKIVVEGQRVLREVLRAGYVPEVVVITQEETGEPQAVNEDSAGLLLEAYRRGALIAAVPPSLLKEMAQTEHPQGLLAVVKRPSSCLLAELTAFDPVNTGRIPAGEADLSKRDSSRIELLVVMDGIQDPGNAGTIVRTAHAAGARALILTTGTVDVYNPKALRATMGSIFYLPLIEQVEAEDAYRQLTAAGYKVVVADVAAEVYPWQVDLTGRTVIWLGSEAAGPSYFLRRTPGICRVKIPMPGEAESLNVAVAAGILCYETIRQRYRFKARLKREEIRFKSPEP